MYMYGSSIPRQNAHDRIIISIFDDTLFTLSPAMPIGSVRENGTPIMRIAFKTPRLQIIPRYNIKFVPVKLRWLHANNDRPHLTYAFARTFFLVYSPRRADPDYA